MSNTLKFTLLIRAAVLVIIGGIVGSCNNRMTEFEHSPVNLRFSTDTVYFDTLLSSVISITKRLRVYNDHEKAVSISTIDITNNSQAYSMIVNGIEGIDFKDVDLFSGDSLLILLNANLPDQDENLPYVVEEKISFNTNGALQEIPVIAWGQDANFIRDSVLICNTVWTKGKPYVVYDNLLVDSLCTLTITPGTRIFSHLRSTIYVKGTLTVKGTEQLPVEFTNDRFDNGFDSAPGQWEGIVFLEGSKSNTIDFTRIKNAHNAIWLGTPDDDIMPDLIIRNSIIENTSGSGLLSFTSDLEMTNTLINNCVEYSIACLAGGNYSLRHNTFVNYGLGFFRNQPVMVFSNHLQLSNGSNLIADLNASVDNNIIWGSYVDELQLVENSEAAFNFSVRSNLIRTSLTELENENILNEDPVFEDPFVQNYRIDTLSPAIDTGLKLGILIDLDSLSRDINPDIGAFEWRIK